MHTHESEQRAQAGSRGGAYAAGRARKAAIVSVASELFARSGFHSVTMIDVAAECGISRAGLLHHFANKELLLAAVLEERDRADDARFRWNDEDDPDGRAWLARLIELVEHNSSVPEIVRLFAVLSAEATTNDHPAHEHFVARYEHSRDGCRKAFERAHDAGILIPGAEPSLLSIELIALLDGLQVQWLLDPTQVQMAAVVRRWITSALTVPVDGLARG